MQVFVSAFAQWFMKIDLVTQVWQFLFSSNTKPIVNANRSMGHNISFEVTHVFIEIIYPKSEATDTL